MNKDRELLIKLLEAAVRLDSAYIEDTRENQKSSLTGEQYDEINDVMADVEEYLESVIN